MSMGGVLGGDVPTPCPELDPREPPERPGAPRLVLLPPFEVLTLEEGPGHVSRRGRRESVDDCESCLPHELLPADRNREVVRERRKIGRRFRSAPKPFEDREDGVGIRPQRDVVELLGECGRCSAVIEATGEPRSPGESAVNARLERRPRSRLVKSLLEQQDRTVEILELSEEHKSLGTERPDIRLGEQGPHERPRARPFAGSLMSTSCGKRALMTFGTSSGCQTERQLGELGGVGRGSAGGGVARSIVESRSHFRIRAVFREREMTGAREGVVQDRREPSVHPQPILAELLVEDRREERMRESDCAVVALDHLRDDGGIECAGGDTGATENKLRGRPERCGQGQGIMCRRGKAVDPRAHELLQGLRNREVQERIDVRF